MCINYEEKLCVQIRKKQNRLQGLDEVEMMIIFQQLVIDVVDRDERMCIFL